MIKKYWKSFDELKNPEKSQTLKETEFQYDVKEEFNVNHLNGISRRKFLAISAATLAFTSTACKDYRNKGDIVPYNQKPENVLPGKANYYSSTCMGCPNHCGILIKTREGRPIKVDGNPDHPVNKGKICSIGQATILNLYDPERYKTPLIKRNGKWEKTDFPNIFSTLLTVLNNSVNERKEIAIISKHIYSPSFAKILSQFKEKYPNTKIFTYEFLENYSKEKALIDFYPNTNLLDYDLTKAKVIVSIESNFLGNEGNIVRNIREFASKRNVNDIHNFSRFYAVESDFTLTGANADYRIPLHPSQYEYLIASIINEIITKHAEKLSNLSIPMSLLREKFSNFNLEQFANSNNISIDLLKQIVKDLISSQSNSIVFAGDLQPYTIHYLCNLLNEILSNHNLFRNKPKPSIPKSTFEDLASLSSSLLSGKVGTLIILDCNPVFHLPRDFELAKGMEKVPNVFAFVESETETALLSNHIVPINHNFESWGDFFDGESIYSLSQPVIEPIYGTYQKESIMLALVDGKLRNNNFHEYLKKFWETEVFPKTKVGVPFEQFWFSVLHDGVFSFPSKEFIKPNADFSKLKELNFKKNESKWTILIKKPYFVWDGKFLNNAWLVELPHPISKVTWDNYIAISENEANKLNLKTGDFVKIEHKNNSLEAPIFVLPGLAEKTLTIEAGFGRTNAGPIGKDVGFDPLQLLSKEDYKNGLVLSDIKVTKLNRYYKFASTVEHHSLNDTFVKDLHKSRHIIQESTVEDFINDRFEIHKAKQKLTIIPEIQYHGVKWAMAIDLNKCTGCGACISACNVENNVPVVGKDQVIRGREMQWIRIDTYFSGTPDNPEVSLQPMLCQHCDDAPCENVCPVVATNHSPDGLNQMIYNRCVGTRYCSNNCPYKVRRFNFFDFRNHFANGYFYQDSLKLLNNPEVTVRSRGVMEKCTFCIQRITDARHKAQTEGREFKGSEVKTACQEACPAEAIIFGNVNDKDSDIYKWRNHKLGYYVLEELNVKPNVTYIAKLRNKTKEDKA